MYVESDFLVALLKGDDWLTEAAEHELSERDDIQTSILSYAEVLVLLYDRDQANYEIEPARAISNLLELVPIEPASHEEAVLAAAAFLEEYDLTPFDSLHAGIVSTWGDRVLSSERASDDLGIERVPLEGAGEDV